MPLLNIKCRSLWRPAQVQQGDPFRRGAEAFLGADGDAAEEAALVCLLIVFHIDEVPAILSGIREDEEGVEVILQQAGDDLSLVAEGQPVGLETASRRRGTHRRLHQRRTAPDLPRAAARRCPSTRAWTTAGSRGRS